MDPATLMRSVEEAFEQTSRGLGQWDDPHPPPDRVVADDEYSRVTNPGKWRIIGARVDAWLDVLVAGEVATVEHGASVEWEAPPGPVVTRRDLVQPMAPGGLPLVVGRSRIDTVDDAGVVLAVGLPATPVHIVPDCGCDACDSGSVDVLREIDTWMGGIVRGELRHLTRRGSTITVIGDEVRQSSYTPKLPTAADRWRWRPAPVERDVTALEWSSRARSRRPFDLDAVLADPAGWREWSGPSWLG